MVTIHDVRKVAEKLPRSYEVLVGGRVKFRVGRIVYLSFSRDETIIGIRVSQGRTGLADRRLSGQIHASGQGRPSLQLGAGAPGRARQEGDARAGSRRVADGRPKRSGKPHHYLLLVWHPMRVQWIRLSTPLYRSAV